MEMDFNDELRAELLKKVDEKLMKKEMGGKLEQENGGVEYLVEAVVAGRMGLRPALEAACRLFPASEASNYRDLWQTYGKKFVYLVCEGMHYTGYLIAIGEGTFILAGPAWALDKTRFNAKLAKGEAKSPGGFPSLCHIGIGAVQEISEWEPPVCQEDADNGVEKTRIPLRYC